MHASGKLETGENTYAADDYRTPVRVLQAVPKAGDLPPSSSLLQIEKNDDIKFRVFQKRSSRGYILRVWNTADTDIQTNIFSICQLLG
jgi:hypothetical protein